MHGDMLKLVGPVSEELMEGAHPAWRRLKRARANIKDPLKLLASVMRGWNARTHAGAYAAGERLLKASQRVFKDPEGRAKNMAAKRGARPAALLTAMVHAGELLLGCSLCVVLCALRNQFRSP